MFVQNQKAHAHEILEITKTAHTFTLCMRLLFCAVLSVSGAIGTGAAVYALSISSPSLSTVDAFMASLTAFCLSLCLTMFSEHWTKAIQLVSLVCIAVLLACCTLLLLY